MFPEYRDGGGVGVGFGGGAPMRCPCLCLAAPQPGVPATPSYPFPVSPAGDTENAQEHPSPFRTLDWQLCLAKLSLLPPALFTHFPGLSPRSSLKCQLRLLG